jgi:uncharacterized protein YggE
MKYLGILVLLFLVGCKNTELTTTKQTINVTGYSQLKAKPDISLITLNASAQSENKSAVISAINHMVDSVIQQIKAQDIRTNELVINNLNVYWNYIYEKEKERKIEYAANQTVEIKMNFDVNEIEKIVQIVRDIPKLNFNIAFDLSKPRKDSLENVVSAMAVEDAAHKASNIAKSTNLRIIKILDITYQTDHPGAFMAPALKSFAQTRSLENINLVPEEIQLNDNIHVTYLVKSIK